jgi:hypothetical protein
MKAALVGYGQMGQMIERLAPEFGTNIRFPIRKKSVTHLEKWKC